jgi:hypothetical protein
VAGGGRRRAGPCKALGSRGGRWGCCGGGCWGGRLRVRVACACGVGGRQMDGARAWVGFLRRSSRCRLGHSRCAGPKQGAAERGASTALAGRAALAPPPAAPPDDLRQQLVRPAQTTTDLHSNKRRCAASASSGPPAAPPSPSLAPSALTPASLRLTAIPPSARPTLANSAPMSEALARASDSMLPAGKRRVAGAGGTWRAGGPPQVLRQELAGGCSHAASCPQGPCSSSSSSCIRVLT